MLNRYSRTLAAILFLMLPAQAFADCAEAPLSYEQLVNLVSRDDVTDIKSLLKALPANSMTNVTLVHDSLSLQKDAITALKPGVLRGTADNKLIFRYVCDDKSPLYNRLEVMRFDEKQKEFKFSSLHLAEKAPLQKVNESPTECVTCHQSQSSGFSMLKPVWNSYPAWPGMYGSSDDYLDPPDRRASFPIKNFPSHIDPVKEFADFKTFAQNEQSNECYTLSLPAKFEDLYRNDKRLYHDNRRQPNLRYSETLGLLYAKGVVAQLEKQDAERFKQYLPYLAQDTFGCLEGGSVENPDPSTLFDRFKDSPRDGVNGRLVDHLKQMGMSDADFNLSLHGIQDYDYVGGLYGGEKNAGRDLNFLTQIRTQLAQRLTQEMPDLPIYYQITRGVSEYYNLSNNACIDDLGGQMVMEKKSRKKLCELIAAKYGAVNDSKPKPVDSNPAGDGSAFERFKNEPGFQVMTQVCVRCHGVQHDSLLPQFLKDPKLFADKLVTDQDFAKRALGRVSSEDRPMPPNGKFLDEANKVRDRQLVIDFLTQVTRH